MALDAVHIRSARIDGEAESDSFLSPAATDAAKEEHVDPQHALRTASPRSHDPDETSWRHLPTGDARTTGVLRPPPRFVKATLLSSEPSQPATSEDDATSLRTHAQQSSAPTLAQLYATLTRDLPSSQPPSPSPSASPSTASDAHANDKGKQRMHEKNHRHHRQHHPDARHKSEWFIARALAKMRRTSQHSPETHAPLAPAAPRQASPQPAIAHERQRCQRCGDLLPLNATPEDMTSHRQSIGHRLGLNAALNSASTSEAPSPAQSKSPTPTTATPPAPALVSSATISLLEASMQALHRRSHSVPRRLCNAPRWKKIAKDNVGHTMLSRMGWKEGMGLGVLETKRHHQSRDKLKQKRSNAIRALLHQHAHLSQPSRESFDPAVGEPHAQEEWLQLLTQQISGSQPAPEPLPLEAAFPFEYQDSTPTHQRQLAQAWLGGMAQADADWFAFLSLDEQQALEHALLSGHITLQDLQTALWNIATEQRSSLDESSQSYANTRDADNLTSDAILYPVQVELRQDRRGIGTDAASARQRRRSRDTEGSVSIRRQSSPSLEMLDGAHKKARASTSGSADPGARLVSRSNSKAAKHKRTAQLAARKRRQRETAYQQSQRE